MGEGKPLADRIKAEFEAKSQRQKTAQQQQTKETEDREKRLAKFGKVCEDLKAVWRPRIDEFARQFGDKIKVTPSVSPSQREAKVVFRTDMATMNMTLSVAPSTDVTKLVLDYDLLILPIFFDYERHGRLEMPLDKVDKAAVGKWLDDQLVSCVKAYLSMQENQIYVDRSKVEDPVTKVKLLREEAKATFEHDGKTYYFSSEESFRKFKESHGEKPKSAPKPQTAAKQPSSDAEPKAASPVASARGKAK